jgi:ubiquinone/menaquinone biosynthesis C-methylase UbiE
MTGQGDTDGWDADRYDDRCGFVSEYGAGATDLLEVDECDRLLDVGCGTGELSRRLADRGIDVVGLDSSREMIGRARERHGAVDGLRFVRGDARDLTAALESEQAFDAVFSNAALHWIPGPDHDAVLEGIARVLRPGGALVAEFGGRGNVASVVDAARTALDERGYRSESPWYFPSVGEYAPRLEAHGLEVRQAHLFDRATALEPGTDGLRGWLAVFGGDLLSAVPPGDRPGVVGEIEDALRDDLLSDTTWTLDYRRIRFRAVRAD